MGRTRGTRECAFALRFFPPGEAPRARPAMRMLPLSAASTGTNVMAIETIDAASSAGIPMNERGWSNVPSPLVIPTGVAVAVRREDRRTRRMTLMTIEAPITIPRIENVMNHHEKIESSDGWKNAFIMNTVRKNTQKPARERMAGISLIPPAL